MASNTFQRGAVKVSSGGDADTPAASEGHDALRVWLRTMAIYKLVYREVHGRLRESFGITLARFDLIAHLADHPNGLRMGEISNRLMVTSGNVTQLTEQLEREGLVERAADPRNQRACLVRLTGKGRTVFNSMTVEHEKWIIDIFSGLNRQEKKQLISLLSKEKSFLAKRGT
jgi:DNA-binding MarR family transcriptional regulator